MKAGEPNHAGNSGGKSLWWAWTAPANGACHVDTIGSAFNTLLAVYTGAAVDGLTEVANNDDSPVMPPASEVTFNAVGGTTYRIALDGYNGADGWITMNLFHAPEVPLHFEAACLVRTNQQCLFQFQIAGPAGRTAVLETVTGLNSTSWTPVATNTLGGTPLTVTLPIPAANPRQFFRAVLAQ